MVHTNIRGLALHEMGKQFLPLDFLPFMLWHKFVAVFCYIRTMDSHRLYIALPKVCARICTQKMFLQAHL